jgi:hypothetical protein
MIAPYIFGRYNGSEGGGGKKVAYNLNLWLFELSLKKVHMRSGKHIEYGDEAAKKSHRCRFSLGSRLSI